MIYYTIYKVTNKINGKSYIGSHKTKDLNDNYMGSGKYLKRSVEKHGIENFTKEILYVFDTPEQMYAKEAELVNEEFIAESNTYNLKVGGFGGFDYINKNKLTSYPGRLEKDLSKLKLAKQRLDELSNDPDWKQTKSKQISQGLKDYYKTTIGHFTGKQHSAETKKKLSGPRVNSTGESNSQYGTMWITNGKDNQKIKKDIDIIPEGWYSGRTVKK
jgi:hypothetical protein